MCAVDMPFLDAEVLRALTARAEGADIVLPVIESDRPECMHAVYRCTCLEPARAALAAGRRRVSSFFSQVAVERVPGTELQRIDPELRSFENVNTPGELRALLQSCGVCSAKLGR
jgi:molybdopterin-guanine dinucleotide biosynthesis protein A